MLEEPFYRRTINARNDWRIDEAARAHGERLSAYVINFRQKFLVRSRVSVNSKLPNKVSDINGLSSFDLSPVAAVVEQACRYWRGRHARLPSRLDT